VSNVGLTNRSAGFFSRAAIAKDKVIVRATN
jgi:hypothetical protein